MFLLTLMNLLGAAARPSAVAPSSRPEREALWVFTDEVRAPDAQDQLLRVSVARGVNVLYLSVYRSEPSTAGRLMYEDAEVARFIGRARARGIEVWAAYGAPDWPALGCRPGSFPYARMQEILAYNRAHPEAPFDGVMLDVEPPEPADLAALVAFYRETADVLAPAKLRTAVAVHFFWDAAVAFEPSGPSKSAFQHMFDLPLDHLVVMGYRNFAGGACPDDGLICLNEAPMRYAEERGDLGRVVVGLRTTSVADDGGPEKVTFHGLPDAVQARERQRVAAHFAAYASFGGFATHRYERPAQAASPVTPPAVPPEAPHCPVHFLQAWLAGLEWLPGLDRLTTFLRSWCPAA